jgi:hypothetical protein
LLVTAGATLTGAASRTRTHDATGDLAAGGAALAGSATRLRQFNASGDIAGAGSVLAGSASRTGAIITHAASGNLVGSGAVLSGLAALNKVHSTLGDLVGGGALITGLASRSFAGSYSITADRALLIYQIALLHGLDPANPLTVSETTRQAGALSQSIAGTDSVTITTDSQAPFSGDLDAWIDALAALHGLTVPLIVTSVSRNAGSVTQNIASVSGVTTVTRQ